MLGSYSELLASCRVIEVHGLIGRALDRPFGFLVGSPITETFARLGEPLRSRCILSIDGGDLERLQTEPKKALVGGARLRFRARDFGEFQDDP